MVTGKMRALATRSLSPLARATGMKVLARPTVTFSLAFGIIAYMLLNMELLRSHSCDQNGLDDSTTRTMPHDLQISRARRGRPMPLCARHGEQASAFLLLFMGHSGSTAIITELRNHSQAHIQHSEPVDHQPHFNTTEALITARHIFQTERKAGKTVGFKLRPLHVLEQPAKWRKLVADFNIRIIWQYRKNVFKSAVGEYSHRYLNDSNVIEGFQRNLTREERCHIGAGCRFRVDNFAFLHEGLRSMVRSQRMISKAVNELTRDQRHACVREMPYEDYLYDRAEFMRDLQRFLGWQIERTAPARFKATGDSLCDVVENWDQLCDAFYGCVLWQHMLDDPRNGCFCQMAAGMPSSAYCDVF